MSRLFQSKWFLAPVLGFAAFGALAALSFIKSPFASRADERFAGARGSLIPASYAMVPTNPADHAALTSVQRALRDVVQQSRDSVVAIRTTAKATVSRGERGFPFQLPFPFDQFRGEQDRGGQNRGDEGQEGLPIPERFGLGSGVILNEDGYIVTNNHVVENADRIEVVLDDRRDYDAEVIGTDPLTDIAVIRIRAKNLKPMPIGDSNRVQLGDFVIAIGAPFGHEHSVSFGIVSAKGRSDILPTLSRTRTAFEDFIQTDAAINPGNSGGPLVNIDGELIGINTAISTQTGQSAGIGFAVSANIVQKVVQDLIANGKVTRAFLGVQISDVDDDVAEELGLDGPQGALVSNVIEGTPAERAGLKPLDIITKMDGKKVESSNHLRNYISSRPVESSVQLEILRGGKRQNVSVKLTALDDKAVAAAPAESKPQNGDWMGMTLSDLTDELAAEFGYDGREGVIVTRVARGSVAEREGIDRGTLLIEVAGEPIQNMAQFRKAIEKTETSALIKYYKKDRFGERYGMTALRKPSS